jgi:oxygen-dependent protoporphyrinogen oxidase
MPQYQVGHRGRVARIEAAIDELPGLWLVNNALHGVGIAPVIAASENLARQIITSLRR